MSNLNLLPESYVKQRYRNRMNMICVVIFGIIFGALVVIEPGTREKYQSFAKELSDSKMALATQQNNADRFMQASRKFDKKRKVLQRDATYISSRPASFYIGQALNNMVGKDIVLTELVLIRRTPRVKLTKKQRLAMKKQKKNPKPLPRKSRNVFVRIRGIARDHSALENYITELSNNKAFEKVRNPMQKLQNNMIKFELELKAYPGDVLNINKISAMEKSENKRSQKGVRK